MAEIPDSGEEDDGEEEVGREEVREGENASEEAIGSGQAASPSVNVID